MKPALSRRLGGVLGRHPNSVTERMAVVRAAEKVDTWQQLPPPIQDLVRTIGARPLPVRERTGTVGKTAYAELLKVGPEGYIHGWIYVGPPPMVGMATRHPELGHGTITSLHPNPIEPTGVEVTFRNGAVHSFQHKPQWQIEGLDVPGLHWHHQPGPAPQLKPPPSLPSAESLAAAVGAASRPPAGNEVRPLLAVARNRNELLSGWAREVKRIRGTSKIAPILDVLPRPGTSEARDPLVMEPALRLAKEHLEGLLRGLEEFPQTRLSQVTVRPIDDGGRLAVFRRLVDDVVFNAAWSYTGSQGEDAYRQALKRNEVNRFFPRGTGFPMAVAIHEFGHAVAASKGERARKELLRQAEEIHTAAQRTDTIPISMYAKRDSSELVAEAFADVLTNGSSAKSASKSIYQLLVEHMGEGA